MKKFASLFLISIAFQLTVLAQADDMTQYRYWIKKADSLYQQKNYLLSAETYAMGFATINRKAYPGHRYNAACSYALAGVKDSALYHLGRIVDNEKTIDYAYSTYDHIQKDSDLISLHKDKRWNELLLKIEAYKQEFEKNMDWELRNLLDSIYKEDQGIRDRYHDAKAEFEPNSPEMEAFIKEWQSIDSSNEVVITQILDKHGWLGKEIVGSRGNTTLFLVIQHASIKTQEKYLPMMQKAVKDGKANGSSLALLEDRVLLRNGKKQIYGSQIGGDPKTNIPHVLPLQDPMNVNQRRASVGLPPLEEYLQHWGLEWNAEEYIKMLPKYEELQKKKKK